MASATLSLILIAMLALIGNVTQAVPGAPCLIDIDCAATEVCDADPTHGFGECMTATASTALIKVSSAYKDSSRINGVIRIQDLSDNHKVWANLGRLATSGMPSLQLREITTNLVSTEIDSSLTRLSSIVVVGIAVDFSRSMSEARSLMRADVESIVSRLLAITDTSVYVAVFGLTGSIEPVLMVNTTNNLLELLSDYDVAAQEITTDPAYDLDSSNLAAGLAWVYNTIDNMISHIGSNRPGKVVLGAVGLLSDGSETSGYMMVDAALMQLQGRPMYRFSVVYNTTDYFSAMINMGSQYAPNDLTTFRLMDTSLSLSSTFITTLVRRVFRWSRQFNQIEYCSPRRSGTYTLQATFIPQVAVAGPAQSFFTWTASSIDSNCTLSNGKICQNVEQYCGVMSGPVVNASATSEEVGMMLCGTCTGYWIVEMATRSHLERTVIYAGSGCRYSDRWVVDRCVVARLNGVDQLRVRVLASATYDQGTKLISKIYAVGSDGKYSRFDTIKLGAALSVGACYDGYFRVTRASLQLDGDGSAYDEFVAGLKLDPIGFQSALGQRLDVLRSVWRWLTQ
jgi:hypothetical protein